MRFMTTVHEAHEKTLSERRKPRSTSTNAIVARRIFGDQNRKVLEIPTVVDDYNHFMNAVDLADQRRAAYTVHQRARRNWLSLFFWLVDISLVNTHLLYELARQEQFTHAIDVGTITLDQITSHPFGKCCEPAKFREVLVKQLLPAPFSNRIGRIRRTYMKKSKQIYFSKHAQGLPPIRQQPTGRPTPGRPTASKP